MSIKKGCCAVYLIFFWVICVSAQELKLEDVLAKHLASIGTPEKRKELKNMMLLGSSEFTTKLPQRKSVGRVAIVSNDSNLLFISSFLAEHYPFEKIGYFDGKINVPFVNPGVRSPLGDFLSEHPSVLESGLFLGSMSLKWSLLDENVKKGKIILGGTKKVNGQKTYVIDYFPRGNSQEFKIRLFFDPETFQHVRSEYEDEFSGKTPQMPGRSAESWGEFGQVNGYRIRLTETFSDFKTYEGVTLPTTTKVNYLGSSVKGTWEYDWAFKVNDVKFNQTLKEDFFKFN